MRDYLCSISKNSDGRVIEFPTGEKRTPNRLRPTGSGVLTGDIYAVAVENTGSSDGTFLGAVLRPGEIEELDAGAVNNTFVDGTLTYDATGTEFRITYLT